VIFRRKNALFRRWNAIDCRKNPPLLPEPRALPPEERQHSPKNATQLNGNLREKVAAFGKTEPYPTEPKSPTDDDLEVF
jgi:hypothetical protein